MGTDQLRSPLSGMGSYSTTLHLLQHYQNQLNGYQQQEPQKKKEFVGDLREEIDEWLKDVLI